MLSDAIATMSGRRHLAAAAFSDALVAAAHRL